MQCLHVHMISSYRNVYTTSWLLRHWHSATAWKFYITTDLFFFPALSSPFSTSFIQTFLSILEIYLRFSKPFPLPRTLFNYTSWFFLQNHTCQCMGPGFAVSLKRFELHPEWLYSLRLWLVLLRFTGGHGRRRIFTNLLWQKPYRIS